MFLKSNAEKGKSEVEKEEMRKHYTPGENVLPEVVFDRDSDESEDERLLQEVRDMSMQNVDPDRARRRAERGEAQRRERRRQEGGNTYLSYRPEEASRQQHSSAWAARQAERQRALAQDDRHVEHQPSLRSLLSASEVDSHEMQEEIMRQILDEGWLTGIDLENLTPAQEEEITERIAQAYRRRQRQRDRSRDRERRRPSPTTPARVEEERRRRHHARNVSASSEQQPQTRDRPPISRPHLFEQVTSDERRQHDRSTSQTSLRTRRSANRVDGPTAPAARSATDLSERPRTAEADRERRRRFSATGRRTTDPENGSTVAQVHRHRESFGDEDAAAGASRTQTRSSHPLEVVRRQGELSNNSSPSLTTPMPNLQPQIQNDRTIRPATSSAAFAPEVIPSSHSRNASSGSVTYQDPVISCSSCNKPSIQYDLHYHCDKCDGGHFDLCLPCYRAARGCKHWFGFGYSALYRYQRAAPPEGWPPGHERPYVLSPRRYARPLAQDMLGRESAVAVVSRSDPASRLEEGAFCESCLAFANDCYWYCDTCLEGAWGFCNTCVNQGKHCTHPLLPVAHTSTMLQKAPNAPSLSLPHLAPDSYAVLPVTTHCDTCHNPIPASSTRFHCQHCNTGDYDTCTPCYRTLVAAGKISADNGPNGWRRCQQGHRTAVIGFADSDVGLRRRVVREPVGGWALKEEPHAPASAAGQLVLPPDGGVGLRVLALWSYFPAPGVEDELGFPKNAEIRECEDINGDWFWGVYAGRKGLFPGNYGRVL